MGDETLRYKDSYSRDDQYIRNLRRFGSDVSVSGEHIGMNIEQLVAAAEEHFAEYAKRVTELTLLLPRHLEQDIRALSEPGGRHREALRAAKVLAGNMRELTEGKSDD